MGEWTTIRELDFEGDPLRIESRGKRWRLVEPETARTVEVKQTKIDTLLRAARESYGLERYVAATGMDISNEDLSDELSDGIDQLRRGLPDSGSRVFLDTTTLDNASRALEGRASASSLLDLAVVSFAMVCFDHVIALRTSAPFDQFDFLHTLDPTPEIVNDTIWYICSGIEGALRGDHGPIARWEREWGVFLGLEPGTVKLNISEYDEYQASPPVWDGVVAGSYWDHLVSSDPWFDTDQDQLNGWLSIQTMRTLFNDKLASRLRTTYIPQSMRTVVHADLVAVKASTQMVRDKLVAEAGSQLVVDRLLGGVGTGTVSAAELDSTGPYMREYGAPLVLGLAMERMATPGDWAGAVSDLRERFQPLRRALSIHEQDSSDPTADAWIARLLEETSQLQLPTWGLVDAIAVMGPTVSAATGSEEALFAGVIAGLVLVLGKRAPAVLKRISAKALRPHIHLLFAVDSEARALRSLENRVRELWPSFSGRDVALLERIAALQPTSYLSLRRSGLSGT